MIETASYDAVIKALRMLKKIRRLEGTVLINEGVILSADTLFHESQIEAFVREINALVSLYRNSGKPLSRGVLGFDGGNVMLFHAAPFTLALLFGDLEKSPAVEKAGEDFLHQWADSLKIDPALIGKREDLDIALFETSMQEEDAAAEKVEDADKTKPISPMPVAKQEPIEEEKVKQVKVVEEEPPAPVVEEGAATSLVSNEDDAESDSMEEAPDKRWKSYRDKVETLFSKVLGRAQATRLLERELTAMGIEEEGYLTTSQFRPFGQKLIKKVKDRTLRKQLENELLALVETYID